MGGAAANNRVENNFFFSCEAYETKRFMSEPIFLSVSTGADIEIGIRNAKEGCNLMSDQRLVR